MDSQSGRETRLLDLGGHSLQELPQQPRETLDQYLEVLYSQVLRPRYNLGNGPPGRAD